VEYEGVTERQSEPEARAGSHYEASMKYRDEFTDRMYSAPLVVKPADREFQVCRQGYVQYLMHPVLYPESCLQDWTVIIHDIQRVSGAHRHQGGLVLMVIEGTGYTTVNGVRTDWKEGDLVLLPLTKGGVEHQHFNTTPGGSAKWFAFISEWIRAHVGSELVQTQVYEGWSNTESA
jgi:mannose-6-phosphate isomerase-like protein (cupin superfamily)